VSSDRLVPMMMVVPHNRVRVRVVGWGRGGEEL
jgi:hypothetical protein